jgi:hypothetical protein
MRVYRLAKARHAGSSLDRSGAKTHGGRWNSKGVALVYTSDTVSLAALELLVHLHRSEHARGSGQTRWVTLDGPARTIGLDRLGHRAAASGRPPSRARQVLIPC